MDPMEAHVVLAVPHVGDWRGYFADTVNALQKVPYTKLIRVENKPIDVARNMLVRGALEDPETTHIFFMDADEQFPPEALLRLLARDKDIIGGTYFSRTDTPIPHVYEFGREDDEGHRFYRSMCNEFAAWAKTHPELHGSPAAQTYADSPGSLVRCDALATGCLLVTRRVFEEVGFPWFECWPQAAAGEDFDFCQKARSKGFEIWADFGVQCSHEARHVFVGAADFCEIFGVGTENEHDWERPVYVEAGPGGRKVRLGVREEEFDLPEVEGYMTDEQGRLLDRFAKKVPADGLIVELGSYKGKSTIALARAGRRVWAVDHFAGERLETLDDQNHAHRDHVDGFYRVQLEKNLVAYGVADNVRIFAQNTNDGPQGEGAPEIDLLYLDAAHDYESVAGDLAAWEPYMKPDGLMIFDDVNFPGVAKALSEAGARGWRHADSTGTMVAVRRPYQEV